MRCLQKQEMIEERSGGEVEIKTHPVPIPVKQKTEISPLLNKKKELNGVNGTDKSEYGVAEDLGYCAVWDGKDKNALYRLYIFVVFIFFYLKHYNLEQIIFYQRTQR